MIFQKKDKPRSPLLEHRQFVYLLFIILVAVTAILCIPFMKPIRFSWVEMNTQFQALVFVFTSAIFLHASLTLSVSNAFRLFFLAFFLSYFAEYISMHWIGLFGYPYNYDPALSPMLPGGVPIIVVFMWFVLAYTALEFLWSIPIRSWQTLLPTIWLRRGPRL